MWCHLSRLAKECGVFCYLGINCMVSFVPGVFCAAPNEFRCLIAIIVKYHFTGLLINNRLQFSTKIYKLSRDKLRSKALISHVRNGQQRQQ